MSTRRRSRSRWRRGERGGEVRHWGTVPHRPDHIRKLVEKLAADGARLHFCYEAGPCGYGLHRQLVELGHDCIVVAPSLDPGEGGRPGEDRPPRCGDAGEAAPGGRADGGLGSGRRARGDARSGPGAGDGGAGAWARRVSICRVSCCGMAGSIPGKKGWTVAYRRWLTTVRFQHPAQQIVFQDYVDAVTDAEARVERLTGQIADLLPSWSLGAGGRGHAGDARGRVHRRGDGGGRGRGLPPVRQPAPADGLSGADTIGTFQRHHGAPGRDHQGRQRARPTCPDRGRLELPDAGRASAAKLHDRIEALPKAVRDIAWKGQLRMCQRYRHLVAAGKAKVVVTTAHRPRDGWLHLGHRQSGDGRAGLNARHREG